MGVSKTRGMLNKCWKYYDWKYYGVFMTFKINRPPTSLHNLNLFPSGPCLGRKLRTCGRTCNL